LVAQAPTNKKRMMPPIFISAVIVAQLSLFFN